MPGARLISCSKPDLQAGEVRVQNARALTATHRVVNSGDVAIRVWTDPDAKISIEAGDRLDIDLSPGAELAIDVAGMDRSGAAVHVALIDAP